MLTGRRRAKQAALGGLMRMLGNMDSQRMAAMQARTQTEDGSEDLKGTSQFPDSDDAQQVLQMKGSDSDMAENVLNQAHAAPPNIDPTDGDPEGADVTQDDDDFQPVRDAAQRGDSTSRRILELFGDEPENDEDETTELEPTDSDDTVTPESGLEYGDKQTGQETAPDRLSPVKEKNLGARTGETQGYVGGDIGRQAGQVGMGTIKLPRRRR